MWASSTTVDIYMYTEQLRYHERKRKKNFFSRKINTALGIPLVEKLLRVCLLEFFHFYRVKTVVPM